MSGDLGDNLQDDNNLPQEEHQHVDEPMEVIDDSILDQSSSVADDENVPPVHQVPQIPQDVQQLEQLCNELQENCDLNPQAGVSTKQKPVFRHAIVLVDFGCEEFKSTYSGTEIRWVMNIHADIVETTATIGRFIEENTPKNLVVACYSQYLGVLPSFTIREHLKMAVMKAQKSKTHKISFATVPFKPVHEVFWQEICELNFHIRNANFVLGQCPLALHKATLTKAKNKSSMVCNGRMWEEKIKGEGLGSTLSSAGKRKYKLWISKHVHFGMKDDTYFKAALKENYVSDLPSKLQDTPGYRGNPKMRQLLKQLGTLQEATSVESPRFPRQQQRKPRQPRHKGQVQDDLRPKLQSIQKRKGSYSSLSSSASSSYQESLTGSSASSSSEVFSGSMSVVGKVFQQDRVRTLEAKVEKLLDEKKEAKERYSRRMDHLYNEIEIIGTKRRTAEEKLLQLESDYQFMKEENRRNKKTN